MRRSFFKTSAFDHSLPRYPRQVGYDLGAAEGRPTGPRPGPGACSARVVPLTRAPPKAVKLAETEAQTHERVKRGDDVTDSVQQ